MVHNMSTFTCSCWQKYILGESNCCAHPLSLAVIFRISRGITTVNQTFSVTESSEDLQKRINNRPEKVKEVSEKFK